ncbi:sphingomyelin phosphodiesterase [Piscirickettsia salmonis]|uniref:sphingomyelin phosphodiesterase n=1 Tax=Piscirickettsia salmonis TaxID=1238 RepID=UPI0007C8C7B5|nr:Phospholipase C precursor [Piscirickettsiaceae bacterium NZ-RLO1]
MKFFKPSLAIFLFGIYSVFIASAAYAQYYLYFINNTDRPVSYRAFLDTQIEGCENLDASYYQGYSGTLQAYQRGKLATINYGQGIEDGKTYCLTAHITSMDPAGKTKQSEQTIPFSLTTRLQGAWVGSSIMSAKYQLESQVPKVIDIFTSKPAPDNVQLETIIPDALWHGQLYKVYAAAIHYAGSDQSTNEIDYVLDQSELQARYLRDDQDDRSLTVATYNVQLWPGYAGVAMRMNEASMRAQLIPQKIKHYDVVVVEELMSKGYRDTFINVMKQDYPYYYGPTSSAKLLTGGQMIFSHWPIVTTEYAKEVFNDCSGVDCGSAKGVLYTKIQKGQMLYNIIGSHLQAIEGESSAVKDTIARDQQFEQLKQFIDARNLPKDQPVIIAGDLNVDYQECHTKQECTEFNKTILTVDSKYQPWLNIDTLPYGGDYTKNLMNTGTYGEMDDYVLVHQGYVAEDQLQQHSRIRVIRGVAEPLMYDGGSMLLSTPYAELDLSDHFLFERKLHFPRELFYERTP